MSLSSENKMAVEKLEALEDESESNPTLERSIVTKIDIVLIPISFVMFIFLFLDRGNIGNARVAGLQVDIHATDFQYQLALMVTYIPYVLIELVSNLILKKVGAQVLLPLMCFLWGVVSLLQCTIQNAAGLLACRFFLGLCEGGLFPGFILYFSEFYRRHELQKRTASVYVAASIAGAFSGLLAAAIQQLNGVGGIQGWRWIFLLEGAVTIVYSGVAFYALPNGPEKVWRLTAEEIAYCQVRAQEKQIVGEEERVTLREVLSVLKDVHVVNMSLIGFCNGIVIGGLSYFTPTIVEALGYGPTTTQLMSVPPYAIALILTMIAAWAADRYHRRGLTSLVTLTLPIIGFILNLTCTSVAARYAAQCLNVAGIYSTAPSILTWVPNNTAGYIRRASAVALVFITSNGAGMVAMWLYPTSNAPRYLLGSKVNLGFVCLEFVLIIFQMCWLRRMNKHKAMARESTTIGGTSMAAANDHDINFQYTL